MAIVELLPFFVGGFPQPPRKKNRKNISIVISVGCEFFEKQGKIKKNEEATPKSTWEKIITVGER